MRLIAPLLILVACAAQEPSPTRVAISTDPRFAVVMAEFIAGTPGLVAGEPDQGPRIVIVDDPTIPLEGYRFERADQAVTVHAHDVLGAQFGVAAALEAAGFRFRHPLDALIPIEPAFGDLDAVVHRPEIRVRGLHLHTLHPIEGYFAMWEPSADSTANAHLIIDWLIKNRGNYLQWFALDDILDPAVRASWQPFTRELIDYAHLRGIRVGLGMQLFGQANLQLAFDLSDDRTGTVPIADEIRARLPVITNDLPFDVYALSFGEFFNSEPQRFIDSVNEVRAQLRAAAPDAEMHALVHVGAKQRVTYLGSELLYYFLVKFTDASIIPDIHSVMFYDLFEPTGGAYQHEDFGEHRGYLEDRICNHQPAAYFPETAYWVAFDNSVPQFVPLYARNRWLDLDRLAAGCGLPDTHLLFSSGWEWGYWLGDTASLRASYERPASYQQLIATELAPDLAATTPILVELIETQRRALMTDRLVAYLAGRDAAIDAGRQLGIISQPDRVRFVDLASVTDWNGFRATVLRPLARYATELDAIAGELAATRPQGSRWSREFGDGLAIDGLRAHFVGATYEATLAQLAGDTAGATRQLDRARRLLAEAQAVVTRRHADLHDTHGRRLIDKTGNKTFYQFGYLFMADTLCYWQRELTEVETVMGVNLTAPNSCLF